MAETVAAIGLAASIVSFVNFGSKLLSRIKELQENTAELPVIFKDVSVQLPLLLDLTQRLQAWTINNASMSPDVELSLNRTITGCMRQISEIDELIQRWNTPAKSGLRQLYKAVGSLHAEKKVMGKLRILETYKSTLQVFFTNAVLPMASTQSTRQNFFDFPYSQVSRFVGRQHVLGELTRYLEEGPELQSHCKVAVLYGMGGQGKTQIALEYCRRVRNSGASAFVCWMDASSETALIRSFATAAEKLTKNSIAFPDDESRVSYLREYLGRLNDKWVLVFDNFDRPDDFGKITTYFPPWHNGVLVITTRYMEVGRLGNGIAVDGMAQDEAVELFLERCRLDTTKENQVQAAAVVHNLGYLPLAIDQAGSYICSRGIPLENFQEYYDRRKEVILKHTPLLWDYRKKVGEDHISSTLTTFTTWEMSLQQIPPDDDVESIVHFLTLSAFLDSRDVGQSLFSAYLTFSPQQVSWVSIFLTQDQWDEFKFQDLLALLRGLSLIQDIQFKNREAHFSLHPLVKEWLRLRSPSADISKYHQEAMQLVSASIERNPEREIDFEIRSNLVAHVDACMTYQNQTLEGVLGSNSPFVEEFANSFASLYSSHGRYNDAEALYTLLLKSQERGEKSSRWQTAMNLANTLRSLGRYEQAAEVTEKVFEERKEYLGSNHLDTLRALEGLAFTHCLQDKYDYARKQYQQILGERERQLGISDLETVRALQCVANCLRHEHQYPEAEVLYGWAMQMRARVEDYTSLCALCCMEGLAIVYRQQARINEAIHLYELVLQQLRTALGPRHSRFLQTTLNLSIAYTHAEKIDAAGYMAKQALEGFGDLFGPDHPDTKRAAEQVAEIQTVKTNISNRALFRGQRQQIAPFYDLAEPRKAASQQELSSLERSVIQERFLNDSKSTTQPGLIKIEKGKTYNYSSISHGQIIYEDNKSAKLQERSDEWSHDASIQTLPSPEKKDAGSQTSSLNLFDIELGHRLPLKDEEGGKRVGSFQLINNSHERSTKNIVDLFAVCSADYSTFIDFLLTQYQLGPDMEDYVGDTQLSRAAKNGHVNMVTYLLSRHDVAADSKNRRNHTPLTQACLGGHVDVMRLFLARSDVDVNARDSRGQTPLLLMARDKRVEAFKVLLECEKVDINAQDDIGQTSLKWWAEHGTEEPVQILLDMGAEHRAMVGPYGATPLIRALVHSNTNIAIMIVKKGIASPDAIQDAFSFAISQYNIEAARLLLETGEVDVNHADKYHQTPLLVASRGAPATVALLLAHGADPTVANDRGQTPLHLAAAHGDPAKVKLLLAHSPALMHAVDHQGHSPLRAALETWKWWIAQQLLEAGARLDPDTADIDLDRLEASKPAWVTEEAKEKLWEIVREARQSDARPDEKNRCEQA